MEISFIFVLASKSLACTDWAFDERSIIFVHLTRPIVEEKKVARKENSDAELNEEG